MSKDLTVGCRLGIPCALGMGMKKAKRRTMDESMVKSLFDSHMSPEWEDHLYVSILLNNYRRSCVEIMLGTDRQRRRTLVIGLTKVLLKTLEGK